jgi:hypothetical protein
MLRIALAAAFVICVLAAPVASAGTTDPYLLRLIGVQEQDRFVDVGEPGESAGDRFMAREGLYRWGRTGQLGAKVGRLYVSCELVGLGGGVINCSATAFVPNGTIVAGGFIRADSEFSVAVLGGTGIYRGVGGVVRVRDIASNRSAYVFRLTR